MQSLTSNKSAAYQITTKKYALHSFRFLRFTVESQYELAVYVVYVTCNICLIIQDLEVNVFFVLPGYATVRLYTTQTTLLFTVSVDFKTKVYPHFTLQLVWIESFCVTHTHTYVSSFATK